MTLTAADLARLPRRFRLEFARRAMEAEQRSKPKPYLEALHPKQRAFVEDKSRRKAALCSRRAGKSFGIGAWLLQGGESDPGGLSVYVARSKGNARLILWPALEQMNAEHQLGLWFREIDGQLIVQLPNGHRIWCAGAKDSSEIGKFRGPKYRRVAIDEAQEYGQYLREMVADVFQPALIDKAGELALTGTPGPVPAGLFYEATTGDGGPQWSTHHWTILDNPYIPNASEELQTYRTDYGWHDDHPTYRREWLGEWVRDDGALVYPFEGRRNTFLELPDGSYFYALAVDLGAGDSARSTSFAVGAVRRDHPEMYVLEVEKRSGLIPSAVAAHIDRFRRQYKLSRIVIDEGALGKGYADEMRQSYGIPVEPAEKSKKRAFQEMVGGDLLSGSIRVDAHKCRDLIDEWQVLQWLPDKSEEDPRFENHASDAVLYLARALRPWYRPEREPPRPGTEEHMRAEMERLKKAAKERARKTQGARNRWG